MLGSQEAESLPSGMTYPKRLQSTEGQKPWNPQDVGRAEIRRGQASVLPSRTVLTMELRAQAGLQHIAREKGSYI